MKMASLGGAHEKRIKSASRKKKRKKKIPECIGKWDAPTFSLDGLGAEHQQLTCSYSIQ